jgi:hypothetical protein
MRNPRQPRCGAAILQNSRRHADEALGTKSEFESNNFSRRNQHSARLLTRSLRGTSFRQSLHRV